MDDPSGLVVALASLGLVGGLVLLARGLGAFRASQRVAGVSTSRIATLAAGEVRLVGMVEPEVMTLVSPLQSVPCVYYRARVREGSGDDARTILDEERAVGFRIRDASGTIRIFPRGARWDAPVCFDEASGWSGDDPPGLHPRAGGAYRAVAEDREAQIAALLTVRPAADLEDGLASAPGFLATAMGSGGLGTRRRDYEERRLEPGDTVTVLGSALPFGDLADPAGADRFDPLLGLDDPEVAGNVAEAREAGLLRATPEEAWGNAAIPGFGIGRPTRPPELDPAATAPPIAPAAEAAASEARFEIPPGELVVASTPERGLAVLVGTPAEARAREDGRALLGLAGAALAIVSALVLAAALPGVLP